MAFTISLVSKCFLQFHNWTPWPLSIPPRKQSTELQHEWAEKAKARADTNAKARTLFKEAAAKNCQNRNTGLEAMDQECIENKTVKFTWMNCEMKTLHLISGGTYGQVFAVQCRDGLKFAAKVLHDCNAETPEAQDDFDNMKSITKEMALRHRFSSCPYIIRVIGLAQCSFPRKENVNSSALMMELAKQSLHAALQDDPSISFTRLVCWAVHVSAALTFLHNQRVVHLDVKLDNVLLTLTNDGSSSLKAVLSDFGLARQASERGEVVVGMNQAYASAYRCPECTCLPGKDTHSFKRDCVEVLVWLGPVNFLI